MRRQFPESVLGWPFSMESLLSHCPVRWRVLLRKGSNPSYKVPHTKATDLGMTLAA